MSSDEFYRDDPSNSVWWKRTPGVYGEYIISFDKKKTYNLFSDYPWKLTVEEKVIFDREYPFWKKFFKGRVKALKD